MKVLLDMNLSPDWVPELASRGWEAVHWNSVGDPRAADHEIMSWAAANDHVVFTHDLDFGALLAAARLARPSVIQIRTQDVSPAKLGPVFDRLLRQFHTELATGALVVFDTTNIRVRILPLWPRP